MVVRRYYTDIESQERIQDASRDAIDAIDTERPWGTITGVKYDDYQTKFGEVVLCNPKDGEMTITLPKSYKKDVGKHVTVKNYSDETTKIYVKVPTDSGTIDVDFTSVFLALAYQVRTFVVVDADAWVQVSGVGF